jgi:hypothetical protein
MTWLYNAIARSGVCSVSGAIAGAFVGGVFGLVYSLTGSPPVPGFSLLWEIAVGLSVVAWLIVLVVVGILGNYGVLRIAVQAFVTSMVTGVLTVWLIYGLNAGLYGMLLGWLLGFAVGRALCSMCFSYQGGAE